MLTALALPATALAVGRLTRDDRLHRVAGGALWAAALARIAAAGSLAAQALHDPLFWELVSAVALGVSAAAGRWPFAAAITAALAGACTMMATLLPVFPDFAFTFPSFDRPTIRESMATLSQHFGDLGALFLFAMWIQGIVASGTRNARNSQLAEAVRGALIAALFLSLAGAVPGVRVDERLWVTALGILFGLAEAQKRARHAARRDT
ncbi:MAG: hypothetical protein A3I61_03385 [Acidobacteria bacterium RIFCSPLOWO2_02_FULL_68_18]|nr:MAG: hypothetical protein A3I61_03385 [Acidobacteria bacterium RIFCSPLOWO2_02_FULL_68_18]OFW48312.1 MAG: hypothetical protein A3G77_03450 [Acidobacteria bacterium RIFCSPLOWO2_12_FULL_68_19]